MENQVQRLEVNKNSITVGTKLNEVYIEDIVPYRSIRKIQVTVLGEKARISICLEKEIFVYEDSKKHIIMLAKEIRELYK